MLFLLLFLLLGTNVFCMCKVCMCMFDICCELNQASGHFSLQGVCVFSCGFLFLFPSSTVPSSLCFGCHPSQLHRLQRSILGLPLARSSSAFYPANITQSGKTFRSSCYSQTSHKNPLKSRLPMINRSETLVMKVNGEKTTISLQ